MTQRIRTAIVATALLCVAAPGRADVWNERTELRFSAPVMVPGATLPAGTYFFELANALGARHLVRVRDAENRVITTTQAIPTRRTETSGDIVVQFNPTEAGAPPAVKSWFFPGERTGHEFIYPEQQARQIAERTKTIVLGVDVAGTDLEQGTLYRFSPTGQRSRWEEDAATRREWDAWQETRQDDLEARRQSAAPLADAAFEGMRVSLDELEEQPTKYVGQQISVDAEVEDVLGPRLFTIDEPNWGDLDGEILVFLPSPLAALVTESDRVTISGSMRSFLRADVEREWGWFGNDPAIEAEIGTKPVFVAERLVGGNNNVAMVIDTTPTADRPVGTSGAGAAGAGAAGAVSDAAAVADGDLSMVGRETRLAGLRVIREAEGGFFVESGAGPLFVLPATPTAVAAGDRVALSGVLLQLPRSMVRRLDPPVGANDDIYVFATDVTK